MNANRIISPHDRRRIEQAIGKAEARTSVEIIAVVATESGRYDRADSTVGLFLALAALIGAQALYAWLVTGAGEWHGTSLHLGWQAASVAGGFVLGNLLSERCSPLRRLLVSEEQMIQNTMRGASHALFLSDVGDTRQGVGLLIYISLFEHRIVLRADESARNALGDAGIERLRDMAVKDLRLGRVTDALVNVIEQAAEPLAQALPATRQLSECVLADRLLLMHPRPSALD